MSYAELYPSLVLKNLIQPRNPPQIPEPLPWWYKPELHCAFHQGAPGHDIENCYLLKYEVQKLMKSGMVSFEDRAPNVKANPLPAHGNSSVNMVDGCPSEFKVFDVRFIRRSLVQMHKDVCLVSDCEHDHDSCVIRNVNPRGCEIMKMDIQQLMDEGMIQIVQSRHVDDEVNVIVPIFKQPERLGFISEPIPQVVEAQADQSMSRSSCGLKVLVKKQAHQAQEHEDRSGKLIKIQFVSSFNFYIKLHNKSKGEDLDNVRAQIHCFIVLLFKRPGLRAMRSNPHYLSYAHPDGQCQWLRASDTPSSVGLFVEARVSLPFSELFPGLWLGESFSPVKGNYVALILIPDESDVSPAIGIPFPCLPLFGVGSCVSRTTTALILIPDEIRRHRMRYPSEPVPHFPELHSSNSNNVSNRLVSPLVIWLAGPVPYSSNKVVSYQYNATMIEGGQEVPLPTTSFVVSIADVTKVTRSGRVFGPVFPKDKEESIMSKKVEVPVVDPVGVSKGKSGESSDLKSNNDDEVLRLIKRSEFNMVEQLLQTPLKILVLSLLMNSEARREALQRVLEQAFVEHDVIVDQFDHIVANITSCNNLSFCDEELPEEGRNHNLALHISMNCKEDALSNVLVDTGSSLNVLPKSTLSKLSYQGAPMRYSGVIVKAFDGSRKTVIGEVDLPVKIGPSDFQITFQALSIAAKKRVGAPMSSLKDAKKIVEEGNVDQWGRMVEVSDNKGRTSLGFQRGSSTARSEDMQLSFRSGGFIHGNEQHLVDVLKDDEEEDCTNFVAHGKACNNWTAIDIPVVLHRSKLVPNPIEYNDPSPSPNFEFLVFEAEEESDVEVSDELSRFLEQDEKTIQSFEEKIELVNLGSEDDVKEVKIGSRLCPDVKKGFSLKPECPQVKQKLRRTHPDMDVKVKEEVHKHIDVGFLVTAEYPQWVANITPVPKKDGKVRMCVDYRDLNKVSSKDDFLLPHIDMLVDNTAKFKVFSFMGGFSNIIRSRWHPKIWRRPHSLHLREHSVIE
ncbi:hypothetical protein KIW84_061406 [Lathyrus oleraceus]|uniref:Uncharacterized protein n=1 Tax=Pisum sativum TaxID=3888 RepID=A0A9D4W4G8_PEA|nr:hypothetical protein KIW84_061406 [Pisum sativum]